MDPDPATQVELLAQLAAITATDTPSARARNERLLRENGWSVERAVDHIFSNPTALNAEADNGNHQHPQSIASSSRAPSPIPSARSPGAREAKAYAGGGSSGGRPRGSAGGNGYGYAAGRVGLSAVYAVFMPIKMVLRLLVGAWFLLVRTIVPLSLLPYFPRLFLPPSLSRSSSSGNTSSSSGIPLHSTRFLLPPSTPLPTLFSGTYSEFLAFLRSEARLGCAIVGSSVHEDWQEFEEGFLAGSGQGAGELGELLKREEVVLWGCDVGSREGWQVAKTLQLTTFPSIVFFSLLPPPASPFNPSSSSSPRLQILTTLSGPPSTTTSPTAVLQALSTSILPRVKPFLGRVKRERRGLEEARRVREEQDRALQESERRDRDRILASRRAREEKEREAREAEEKRKREEEEAERRKEEVKSRKEVRGVWRKWAKANLLPEEPSPADVKAGNAIRVQLRLPQGLPAGSPSGPPARHVRAFSKDSEDPTTLFIWAETLLIPATEAAAGLSVEEEERFAKMLDEKPEWAGAATALELVGDGVAGVEGGVRLFTTYPRKEVVLAEGKEAWAVVVSGGGSLVMEVVGGADDEAEEEEDSEEDEE